MSRRIVHFAVLAVILSTANTFGSTIAASLFLNRVGVASIPAYYIMFAGLSIPVTVGFARIIDRWPRRRLFSILLLVGIGISLLLAAVGSAGGRNGYFVLYVVVSVIEQLSYSVFYVLLADYLTSLEVNRGTTLIAIAMALGGLQGGGFVWLFSLVLDPSRLLFGMPALLGAALVHFAWVARTVRALPESEPEAEHGLLESLAAVPALVGRYPIIPLLALGIFLNIVVQSILEYQVFFIYVASFPDERELTGFLGVMNAALNAVGIATSYLVTRPLLRRLGVGGMNLVYPGIMVSAFAVLAAFFRLPAAIVGHIVYDALAHSVDAPVFLANYNAVPHRLVGRVRVVNDGVVYPLAMTVAGAMLVGLQSLSSPLAVTLVGAFLALAFWWCGIALRRSYERSLVGSLREGSIDLAAAAVGSGPLPKRYWDEIAGMLASGDPRVEMLGLEMAVRADPMRFMADIERLLSRADATVRGTFVSRLGHGPDHDLGRSVHALLGSREPSVRAAALQVLVTRGKAVPAAALPLLLEDADPEVAGFAWVAAHRQGPSPAALPEQDLAVRGAAIRALACARDRALLPFLIGWWPDTPADARVEVLDAAAVVARPGDEMLAAWALENITHSAAPVRVAAARLLGAVATPALATPLTASLADPVREVRQAASTALAALGADAVAAVRPWLDDPRIEVEEAAIEAIGRLGPAVAEKVLYEHMKLRHFPAAARNLRWRRQMPETRPDCALLRAAVADSDRRSVRALMQVLAALGLRRTIDCVGRIMVAGDERMRANAIEAIASLRHRRFVLPLLPLMESLVAPTQHRPDRAHADLAPLLAEAATASDPWIRLGAKLAACPPDRDLADDLPPRYRDRPMSRLLFLREIQLFDGLGLDELLAIDDELTSEAYLAGEAIVRQGGLGDKLYLIFAGGVSLRVRNGEADRELARLGRGQFFGEMALFDSEPRSASAVAVGDATMLALARDRFTSLVIQRPEILIQICKVFSRRLREANAR